MRCAVYLFLSEGRASSDMLSSPAPSSRPGEDPAHGPAAHTGQLWLSLGALPLGPTWPHSSAVQVLPGRPTLE